MRRKISKIAFIDSGYGGLLLSSEVHKTFPSLDILYIGDTKNMPYGEKEVSFLNDRYKAFQKFAKENGVDLLVVACNTLSATSHQTEEKLVDTIDIISVSVDYLNKKNIQRLALVATPNTIKSKIYQNNLNQKIFLQEVSAKNLASLIEEDNIQGASLEFNNLIEGYNGQILLGCTHYSALIPVVNNLNLISQHTILIDYLNTNFEIEKGNYSSVKIIVNSNLDKYQNFGKSLYSKEDIEVKLIEF